jgi:CRISPR/Cas system endoribonuclease Cas6 (RAMP superfamily)
MSGPASLLQIAVDAGLGAKNSLGFGLLEMINKNG